MLKTTASRLFACAFLVIGPRAYAATVTNRDVFAGYTDYGRNSSSDDDIKIEGESAVQNLLVAIAISFVGVSCFCLFSVLRPKTSDSISAFFMERTTSPLAGVQMFLIFIATSLSIVAALSPEHIVVVTANDLVGVQYASLGIWYQHNAFVTTNDPTANADTYPCSVFLPSSNMTTYSPNSWEYSNDCEAVRASSCITAVAGSIALVFGFYHRQRLILPLLFVCLGAWVFTVAMWQLRIVPKFNDMMPPKVEDVTVYFVFGNGFGVTIFALVCFLAELLCWFVDWFRLKPHTEYARVLN